MLSRSFSKRGSPRASRDPSQRRPHLRARRGRRDALLDHGARRRRVGREHPRTPEDLRRRYRSAHRRRYRRCARRCARRRDRPPRRQARQHHGRAGRAGGRDRLRDRPRDARRSRRTHVRWDTGLYGPRAGRGGACHPALRSLCPRRDAVRNGGGLAPVLRELDARPPRGPTAPGAARRARASAKRHARVRRDRQEGDVEGSSPPLSVGRGALGVVVGAVRERRRGRPPRARGPVVACGCLPHRRRFALRRAATLDVPD
jgi:hypothetical protein